MNSPSSAESREPVATFGVFEHMAFLTQPLTWTSNRLRIDALDWHLGGNV